MNTFKIGDRVTVGDRYHVKSLIWRTGTICYQMPSDGLFQNVYGVRFDTIIAGGHTCSGHCTPGHGWNIDGEYLLPILGKDISESEMMEVLLIDQI